MYLYDPNVRRQLARERVDELAGDWRRAQKAAVHEHRQLEQAERAAPSRRRRPADAAAQRP